MSNSPEVMDAPAGYKDIPEADRKKAKTFFDYARTAAGTGNYEYAINMYLQGLAIDPDAVDAHAELRDASLKRKASGGKDLGMLEKMKLKRPSGDDKANLLTAERLLAFDPGNTTHMVTMIQSALRAGFYDTVMWLGPILQKANHESGKYEDANKYLALKDVYKELKEWKLAADACHYALRVKPDDMELQTEVKNLNAQDTITKGRYEKRGSFRDSVRNMDAQRKLLDADKGVNDADAMARLVADARAEYEADPNEPGKVMKYVEALVKTERPDAENQAVELLEQTYDRTKAFRFRQAVGRIKVAQMNRTQRTLQQDFERDRNDAEAKQALNQFLLERYQWELDEYRLWAENYPTDSTYKFEAGVRLLRLQRFDEAIPVFQQVRNDPKLKTLASIYLGQAFLAAGFVDEAADTLRGLIDEYAHKGDDKSIEMHYLYGRALEQKGDKPAAIKAYSQVAQWNFNYKDVQTRIKALRAQV